jgi:predicted O-methyltransferase YrrM
MNDTFEQFLKETPGCGTIPEKYRAVFDYSDNKAQQSYHDVELLRSMLRIKKPRKILEIGVALGGGTKYIFDELDRESTLFSIDINKKTEAYDTGYLAKQYYDKNKHCLWKTYFGYDVSQCIEEVGKEIDFIMLDTKHVLPGEVLSYLVVLPFVDDNAVIVVHDISWELSMYHYFNFPRENLSNSLLFHTIVSQYKFFSNAVYSNIGAVIINKQAAIKYIYYVIFTLFRQWSYIPPTEILEFTAKIINKFYNKSTVDLYNRSCSYAITRYRHPEYMQFHAKSLFQGCSQPSITLPYLDPTRDIKFDIRTRAAFHNALRQTAELTPVEAAAGTGPGMFLFPQYRGTECDCSLEEYWQRAKKISIKCEEKTLSAKAEELRGQEVYFFGCGAAYAALKHLFTGTRPKAILLTMPPEGTTELDGIPVRLLQDMSVLAPLPIIVFCRTGHLSAVQRVLKHYISSSQQENILFCLLADEQEQ